MNYVLIVLVVLLGVLGFHDHMIGKERDKYMQDLATSKADMNVEKGVAKTCSDANVEQEKQTEVKTENIAKAQVIASNKAQGNLKKADEILTSKPTQGLSELDQVNEELNKFITTRGQENATSNSSTK